MLEAQAALTVTVMAAFLGMACYRRDRHLAAVIWIEGAAVGLTFAATGPLLALSYPMIVAWLAMTLAWLGRLPGPATGWLRARGVLSAIWAVAAVWASLWLLGVGVVEDLLWPLLMLLVLYVPTAAWSASRVDAGHVGVLIGATVRLVAWAGVAWIPWLLGLRVESGMFRISYGEYLMWLLVLAEVPVLALMAAPSWRRTAPDAAPA